MKKHSQGSALLVATLMTLFVNACSDGPTEPKPGVIPPRTMQGAPVRVIIDPAADTIRDIGGTKTFQAVAVGEDDQLISSVSITWHTLNPGIATVGEASGTATAIADGTARITASAGNVTGEALLVVDAGG